MTMKKSGFTLVEIMIVVLIIGLLAAIAVPNFVKARKSTQENACKDNQRQIIGAIEQALMDGKTASDIGDSVTSASALIGADNYIKTTPTCPTDKRNYTITWGDAGDYTVACPNGHELESEAEADVENP